MGTPHHGAHLANLLKTILNVSFSKTKSVEDMSPDSQSIKDINDAFGERAKRLGLASFWESTGMESAGVCHNDLFYFNFNRSEYPRFLQH